MGECDHHGMFDDEGEDDGFFDIDAVWAMEVESLYRQLIEILPRVTDPEDRAVCQRHLETLERDARRLRTEGIDVDLGPAC